jgi:hypothetical protein
MKRYRLKFWLKYQTKCHRLIVALRLADHAQSKFLKVMRVYAKGKLKRRSFEVEGIGRKHLTEIIVVRIYSLDINRSLNMQE